MTANEGIPELKIPCFLLAGFAASWGLALLLGTIGTALGIVHGQGVQIGNNPIVNLLASVLLLGYFVALAIGALGITQGKVRSGPAWAIAILATIPCCSPWVCFGMIPGIWLITQLNKPDVKARLPV